jgi:hypothetical protein
LLIARGHPAANAAKLAQDARRTAQLFRFHWGNWIGRESRRRAVDERIELREHRVRRERRKRRG